MSKKCVSCGRELIDEIEVCPDCGGTGFYVRGSAGNAKKPIIIVLIVAVIGVAGFFLLRNFFGYRGALNNYFDAIEDGNGEEYAKTIFFDDLAEALADMSELSLDDFYDTLNLYTDVCDSNLEDRFGKDYKISYKITGKEKLSDEQKEALDMIYSYFVDDVDIGAGYEFELEITVKGDKDEKTFDASGSAVKINGDWTVAGLVADDCKELDVLSLSL